MRKSKTATTKKAKTTKRTKKHTYEILDYSQALAANVAPEMFTDEFIVLVDGNPYVSKSNRQWNTCSYYRSRAAARKTISRLRRGNK